MARASYIGPGVLLAVLLYCCTSSTSYLIFKLNFKVEVTVQLEVPSQVQVVWRHITGRVKNLKYYATRRSSEKLATMPVMGTTEPSAANDSGCQTC